MSAPSRLYRLIEERLDGTTLADYVTARRPGTPWKVIAAELTTKTRIEVSGEALRLWFAHRLTTVIADTVSAA